MELIEDRIEAETLIPTVLQEFPQCRGVLDRYGLRGCGGTLGPVESLSFFARAHEVPLSRLLAELRVAVNGPASEEPSATFADAIYRPFFKSGIVVVLTLGAVWGAYLLLRIGFTGTFHAASLHEVNAHGHAQIFGWVGLFVMGFAYQAFPRFKHTSLAYPGAAWASLVLMLSGIVGRSLAEPLDGVVSGAGPVAVASSVVETAAVGLFLAVIFTTWRRSGKGLAYYDWYIVSSLVWFLVQALYETVYLTATLTAPNREQLIALVATYQGALRDIQIHGFALLMILGVSQRLFHTIYGLPAPHRMLSLIGLFCLNLAILGEVTGLILMRQSGRYWASVWYLSVLLLAVTIVVLVVDWRIFGRAAEPDRSLKFLRTAYGWLLASLAMLVLLPVYQFVLLPGVSPQSEAAQLGFSHAYYGAIRHAITVGFVSLMIVGVAAKVVPTLNGVDVKRLPGLWIPFVLLNVGCAMRVLFQTLTDHFPAAFPIAGVSGVLEVLGLAIWAVHLWRTMAGRWSNEAGVNNPPTFAPGEWIEGRHRVGEVLTAHPELLDAFLQLGFTPLANPLLRRTLARFVSISQACRRLDLDEQQILVALNLAARPERPIRISLPILQSADASARGGSPGRS
jgi:hypothetical protein